MKVNNLLLIILVTINCITGCNTSLTKERKSSNTDSIKNIILKINSDQQSLYKNLSNKKERSVKYAEFCHDSLLTITGYGSLLTSSYDASQDLVDGYADTIHNITFRLYGNTAILTGQAKMFVLINNDTLYENIWISKVFMNFDGVWKMVLRNSGPLGTNYRIPVKIEAAKLMKYEGVYGFPMDVADTFRVENEHLYQVEKNKPKVQFYPLNDSTYFTKDDLSTIVFRTNSTGAVTHFDWILPDGQSVKIPRK
jgi:hypothetical protein